MAKSGKKKNGDTPITPMREDIVGKIIGDIKSVPELAKAWENLTPKVRNRLRVKWLNITQKTLDCVGMFA